MNDPHPNDRPPQGEAARPEPPSDAPGEETVSLEKLRAAFAETIGAPAAPAAAPASESPEPAAVDEPADVAVAEDDTGEISPRMILEAILFVGDADSRPLSAERIARGMRGVEPEEIDQLVRELNRTYRAEGRPYKIHLEGPGYRMMLRAEFDSLREKFYGRMREARLSQAAVDVLALVAYNQGMTREQVDEIREKSSSAVLRQLVRRGLLRMEVSEAKPRTRRYFTTDRFLDLFGLESLEDLPQSQELEEMS